MAVDLESLLVGSIGILMLANLVLAGISLHAIRVGFGSYLKLKHPEQWSVLATRDERMLSPPFGLDASQGVRRFRVEAFDDLGDPELASRRTRANRFERAMVYCWLGTAVWAAFAFAILLTSNP